MNIVKRSFDVAAAHKWITGAILALLVAVFGIGGIYVNTQSQAQAQSRDCSANSIIKCGAVNYDEMTKHYDANTHGDVRAIMDHYWIKRAPASGDQVLQGYANNKGEIVTSDGRVVGRNASSIGRVQIPHSQPIEIAGKTYYQTTHVGGKAFANPSSSLAATIVLDANGSFKYAWVNACGNPIFTPEPTVVPPPAPPKPPKPQPKDIKVCDLETKKIVTIKENEYDRSKHSKNLKDCEEKLVEVCEIKTKNIVTIKEENFDKEKHSKNLKDCDEVIIKVCDLDTKTIISITEDQFNSKKHSKNLSDCEEKPVKVCEIESKTWVEVPADQANNAKYSTDRKDCEETPVVVETPRELPQTGTGSLLSGGIGLTAITTAAYYYYMSRRGL